MVRCAVGGTDGHQLEVGLLRVLALSPFLFVLVVDKLTN